MRLHRFDADQPPPCSRNLTLGSTRIGGWVSQDGWAHATGSRLRRPVATCTCQYCDGPCVDERYAFRRGPVSRQAAPLRARIVLTASDGTEE